MITTSEIAWLAGLLEGEGSFMVRRGGKDLVVQIMMTDKDVIDRVFSLLGFGTRKRRDLPSGKTAFGWSVTNQSQAAGLMMTVLPFMGTRRSQKIRECLEGWKAKPKPRGEWTHCSHGHELAGNNLLIVYEGKYKKRRCRKCAVLREQKYRAKKSGAA